MGDQLVPAAPPVVVAQDAEHAARHGGQRRERVGGLGCPPVRLVGDVVAGQKDDVRSFRQQHLDGAVGAADGGGAIAVQVAELPHPQRRRPCRPGRQRDVPARHLQGVGLVALGQCDAPQAAQARAGGSLQKPPARGEAG